MQIFNATGSCPDYLTDEEGSQRLRVTITAPGGVADIKDRTGRRVEHLTDIEVRQVGSNLILKGTSTQLTKEVGLQGDDAKVEWIFREVEDLVLPVG